MFQQQVKPTLESRMLANDHCIQNLPKISFHCYNYYLHIVRRNQSWGSHVRYKYSILLINSLAEHWLVHSYAHFDNDRIVLRKTFIWSLETLENINCISYQYTTRCFTGWARKTNDLQLFESSKFALQLKANKFRDTLEHKK